MIHQKLWLQYLLICAACLCCLPISAQQHSKSCKNNPLIQQALQAYGIFLDSPPQISVGLEYPIFHGKSALRSLPDACRRMVQQEHNKPKVALLLLLAGHGDAAHDVLLGTTWDNLVSAEYAATHRGQTNWAQEHPLSDLDDVLHSLIHRMVEGSGQGEGGYTGYENAQYWCAGGPKQYPTPIAASNEEERKEEETTTVLLGKVYQELCQWALKQTPICISRGIVVPASKSNDKNLASKMDARRGISHNIIAGGGKFRQVLVPEGCWDPIVFCQLLLENETADTKDQKLQSELESLTEKELELLTKYLLLS